MCDGMLKDIVEAKEEAWKRMEKKMEEAVNKVGSIFEFNVGGPNAIPKSTLLSHTDTYFSSLLCSDIFKVLTKQHENDLLIYYICS